MAKAPAWVRVLPLGEVSLTDGRKPFAVDLMAVEAIILGFKARGVDLVVDYEHQSLSGGKAPAAGWIKELKAEADGLWARVEWTESARGYLETREYRYFSPVLRLDPETRRPTALLHLALTNTPAIANLDPLVAKAQAAAPKTRQFSPADRESQEVAMKEELKKLLGIAGDKPDEEILALADARLKTAMFLPEIALAVGLEADASPAQVKGAVLALKQGSEHLTNLQGEVAALKAESAKAKAAAVVDEALKGGKVQPSQQEWALEYAARDLEGFKVYAEKAPKVVPVGEAFKMAKETGAGPDGLTPDELAVCKQLNLTPEAFKAQRQAMQEG